MCISFHATRLRVDVFYECQVKKDFLLIIKYLSHRIVLYAFLADLSCMSFSRTCLASGPQWFINKGTAIVHIVFNFTTPQSQDMISDIPYYENYRSVVTP